MYKNTFTIARAVQPYFCSPYRDKDATIILYCDKCSEKHIVHRPNHGLAHGVRQGLLAVAIANILHFDCDLFLLQVAASFQRTGRESEISSHKNPTLYSLYEQRDVQNFSRFAQERGLSEEARVFTQAIPWSSKTQYARILHAAHHFDLRRIPSFDEKIIKDNILRLITLTEKDWKILW